MLIAEALAEKAHLDQQVRSLRERAKAAARYLEGEEPAENAEDLLRQARDLIRTRGILIAAVNHANAREELRPGMTVTEALARRSAQAEEIGLLTDLADAASPGRDPYSRGRRKSELPEKTDLSVTELRAEADRLSKERRVLDADIQHVNWAVELP